MYEYDFVLNMIVHNSLNRIARKYEISTTMIRRLLTLQNYEIVIVCDDSGSMMTPVDRTERTRWDELRSIVKRVLDISIIFDSKGVDVHFINGLTFHNVKDSDVIDQAFAIKPSGYTPLVPVLEEIFQLSLTRRERNKKLLVFICTDGAATDEEGNETLSELHDVLTEKRRVDMTFVSFLLCTDDPNVVEYFSQWNQTMKHVYVTDYYYTEKEKIRKYRGHRYPFSRGDYIVKALVGAIDREMDVLNEPEPRT